MANLSGEHSLSSLPDDQMLEGDENIVSNTPQIGMEFATQQEAYDFYNRYALKTGFGIRWSSTYKSKSDDKIIVRKIVCNKQGQRTVKNIDAAIDKEVVHSRQVRVGCNAKIKINLTDSNTWKVTMFVEQHVNHELTTPTKTHKHRSHKTVHRRTRVKNLMADLHSEGVANSTIARVVNVLESTQQDIVTPQQVHDYLRIEKKNNIGLNCAKIIKHFQEKKDNDSNFYFSLELAEDLTLRSVFWADGRSRQSYVEFSDVIVFDVTYRTNNFSLPFAPFTGINHHRQSTLFGCALLADETEETFVWLFQQWLKCMCGKAPTAIITDQDAAIGNAISRVFPNTRHRFCDWHMDKNIGEHMVNLKISHGVDFEMHFNRLRNSNTIPEAEKCWEEIMTKYKLGERSWLPKLWEKRKSWIRCYLKNIFLAGTTTSQRAESINSFFDTFVNAKTSLNDFVIQYDKALKSRRTAEEDEDFNTMNSKPVLTSNWKVEEQAANCYTKALFIIFKQELKFAPDYWKNKVYKEGTITKFEVGRPNTDKSEWRIVTYDSDGVFVSCECMKFEFVGLLCRHALNILFNKHLSEIPDRYILRRWTIDARHRHASVDFVDTEPTEVDRDLYWTIQYQCKKALEVAFGSTTFAEKLNALLSNALADVDKQTRTCETVEFDARSQQFGSQVSSSGAAMSQNLHLFPEFTIRDPTGPVKTKGRPRAPSRIQSSLEESQIESNKKQRTCGFCHEKGHYITGCAKAKATNVADAACDGHSTFPDI